MKKRPIIFSEPMVRAILAGTKTQTRRVVKWPKRAGPRALVRGEAWYVDRLDGTEWSLSSPYGQPSDRLWVRETWAHVPVSAYRSSEGVEQRADPGDADMAAIYRAGWERSCGGIRWRPSIHMPRWASRITLEITAVRVERLHDISDADAFAEGLQTATNEGIASDGTARGTFRALWESINGPGSWNANPWVWVIEFKPLAAALAEGK
jgi:hypothetical protein